MTEQGSTVPLRPDLQRLIGVPDRVGPPTTPAWDVTGTDLAGAPCSIRMADADRTLLVFLSSGCEGCLPFWPAVADPASLGLVPGEAAVVVARDRGREDPVALARLVVAGSTVVLSSDAWSSYRVQGPPFFALVDAAAGRVVTEGVAWAVPQVAADVCRALRRPAPATG